MSAPKISPRPVRAAVRAVAFVDRLCGASRRYRAGSDLVTTFADEARDTHDRSGAPGLLWLSLAAAADLVVEAFRFGWRAPARRRRAARPIARGELMQTFAADLRLALRNCRRQPGFTLAVVLTLTLGISANSTIFTLVDALLLRPLPYPEPERLVRVDSEWREGGGSNVNPLDVADWRRETPALEALAAWSRTSQALTGAGEPAMIQVGFATASFFDVLRTRPALGRLFGPEHERPERGADLVISEALWREALGADPAVIGRTLTVGGTPGTVIGVLPRTFASPGSSLESEPQLWRAFVADPTDGRVGHWMRAVGRLQPDATLEAARAQLAEVSRRLAREFPQTNTGLVARPVPLAEAISGDSRPALLLLMAAVGVVLLIACANVAHLLLARAAAREREMAVRGALGAGRGRLLRQLLTESLLYATLAGALGVGVAGLALRALPAVLTASIPAVRAIELDLRVVAFTMALSAIATVIFGLAPAMAASRADLRGALGAGGRAAGGRAGRLQAVLLVGETALALALLVSATLLLESFTRLQSVDPGFAADDVLTFRVSLPQVRYATAESRSGFFRELDTRLAALPGVTAAGAVNMAPLTGRMSCDSFGLADRPAPPEGQEPCAEKRVATRDYFRAMSIRQLAGRGFETTDTAESAPVVVVSESMAQRWWPNGDALGQRFKWGSVAADGPWWTVVGVVSDVKFFGLDAATAPEVYMSIEQWQSGTMTAAVRAQRDPATLVREARAAVAALDPELPLFEVMTTRQLLERSTVAQRFRTRLLATFAAAAMALAMIGIHGVMAFYVAQRSREIGIRMSLGASPGEVRWQVVRRGMGAALAGVALGLAASLVAARLLEGLLFGVSATDATAFVAAPIALLATALLASLLPARRATRVDPLVAMRIE